ncbi:MAG: PilZ domain-containing protein [Terriglobales bacterium]|jgi:hypothetical protein
MSAAPSMALEKAQRRAFSRYPISVPLDLIALRSGVPENLPGRCTDISESGVGLVVAGELGVGLQVAVEFRLPQVGVPVRVRALVRYQSRLHCGLEFVGLSAEQREMIRYWIHCSSMQSVNPIVEKPRVAKPEASAVAVRPVAQTKRGIRIPTLGLYLLIAAVLALMGLAWWQWQRSWNELEKRPPAVESELRVSLETVQKSMIANMVPMSLQTAPGKL